MRTFYTNDFEGRWPVPVGAVVLAKDKAEARRKFQAMFKKHDLVQGMEWTVHEVFTGPAVMLSAGDY